MKDVARSPEKRLLPSDRQSLAGGAQAGAHVHRDVASRSTPTDAGDCAHHEPARIPLAG